MAADFSSSGNADPDIANPNAPLSVSGLNRRARLALEERLNLVWVTGELSNFARPRSGHWYFTLKDDQAQVRCAMFANRNRTVQMQPGEGQQVLLRGRVSLYEGRGDYQIIVDHMQAAGEGALRQAFERLQRKLQAEGLFASELKQPLPDFPQHVAVVTSPSGAALKDVLAVWRRRYPSLRVTLVPTQVQGDAAQEQIIKALQRAAALQPDAILLTRGGGSLEDLWTFNLEAVARAIVACPCPIVSAVGHEIDVTISDLAADLRAPTPSAGAELLVPDLADLDYTMVQYQRYLVQAMQQKLQVAQLFLRNLQLRVRTPEQFLQQAAMRIDDASARIQSLLHNRQDLLQQKTRHLTQRLQQQSPNRRIAAEKQQLAGLNARLQHITQQNLTSRHQALLNSARMLHSVSPLPTIARGYAVVTDQTGNVVSEIADLKENTAVKTYISDGAFTATVQSVTAGEAIAQDVSDPT